MTTKSRSDRWVGTAELAKRLGASRQTIHNWRRSGFVRASECRMIAGRCLWDYEAIRARGTPIDKGKTTSRNRRIARWLVQLGACPDQMADVLGLSKTTVRAWCEEFLTQEDEDTGQ